MLRISSMCEGNTQEWFEFLSALRDKGIDVIVEGDYRLVKEFGMSQKTAQDIVADWYLENRYSWFNKDAVARKLAG